MNIRLNGEDRKFPDGLTIAALIEELGLRADQVAVEVNRELVPRDRHAGTELGEGDVVEMVTLVGGG